MPTDGTSFAEHRLGLVLKATAQGLIIEDISGLAAQVDLRRGDIIIAVGQKLVHDEKDFDNAVAASGKNVPLLIRRANNTLFIAMMLP